MVFEFNQLEIDADSARGWSSAQRKQLLLEKSDLIRSSGAWILFPQAPPVFDAMNAGQGLGYNAGAMFGVLQHPVVWSDDPTDPAFAEFRQAANLYMERNPSSSDFPGDHLSYREQIRNYIAANVLEQFADQAMTLESFAMETARKMTGAGLRELYASMQFFGRLLIVDFGDRCDDPVWHLFCQRILAEPVANGKVRFLLPISTCQSDLEFLMERIIAIWNHQETSSQASARIHFDSLPHSIRDTLPNYRFHAQLLACKMAIAQGRPPKIESELDFIKGLLPQSLSESNLFFVTHENWIEFRDAVAEMQTAVYEPSRQTEIKKFDQLLADDLGFGLIVMAGNEIAGMAFVGPIDLFPEERGTLDDPYRNSRHTMYILDLTVANDYRGSLGKVLKQAITLLSVVAGHRAIHGRNRDRLAAGMWTINLGMGSFELKRLVNDYPDNHRFRDCIYYRCPLSWPKASLPQSDLPDFENDPEGSFQVMAELVNG